MVSKLITVQKFKIAGKLKFKIEDHRINTKSEFWSPQLKQFGKKTWSIFGANWLHPNWLQLIEYYRVSYLIMAIL